MRKRSDAHQGKARQVAGAWGTAPAGAVVAGELSLRGATAPRFSSRGGTAGRPRRSRPCCRAVKNGPAVGVTAGNLRMLGASVRIQRKHQQVHNDDKSETCVYESVIHTFCDKFLPGTTGANNGC